MGHIITLPITLSNSSRIPLWNTLQLIPYSIRNIHLELFLARAASLTHSVSSLCCHLLVRSMPAPPSTPPPCPQPPIPCVCRLFYFKDVCKYAKGCVPGVVHTSLDQTCTLHRGSFCGVEFPSTVCKYCSKVAWQFSRLSSLFLTLDEVPENKSYLLLCTECKFTAPVHGWGTRQCIRGMVYFVQNPTLHDANQV